MMVLVSYDVRTLDQAGARRLRRIAKVCQDFGQRVQLSVFEIEIDSAKWVAVQNELCSLIDPATDSLRFYYLGKNWQHKIEHVGAKPALDLNAPLIL
ncbi:CRISPR-associated endonuclease Cas2 [Ramlibacter tataouinensis]|uniref:CRISPR-associated endoribonuclease Cas2 n=1 Tax=Ramlibacter tataouinensis (strain ATCC BAA-407 / DSM 14655 / LMG 21543 / TTB310) TaxID=365046 RepID=F5Y039_RAMTT|nr:CRISPR-associated endonuclease Cas2 [Ramlibacter tataouinensis]AEG94588.1 CRISPR-associated protein Cas2-like protein [Ramlibacter tataouinensis TTB310]